MTSRREFLSTATTLAAAGPAYPDLTALFAAPSRHRQVFGVRQIHDGSALNQIKNSLNAYQFARAEGRGTMHVVAVLYGLSVALALNDKIWIAHDLAAILKAHGDPVLRSANMTGNPFLRPPGTMDAANPGDPRSAAQDASLTGLMKRGVSVLVCDNALADFALSSVTFGRSARHSIDSVVAQFRANLIAGAVLVPAGVAALNDAQEARYTYVAA